MNEPSKAWQELRAVANKLTAYLEHCDKGIAERDAKHVVLRQTKDAIRSVEFEGGALHNVQAEGADALAK